MHQSKTADSRVSEPSRRGEDSVSPLSQVLTLFSWFRVLSIIAGTIFLLTKLSDVFLTGMPVDPRILIDIAIVTLAYPALVWLGTKWASKLIVRTDRVQAGLNETTKLKIAAIDQAEAVFHASEIEAQKLAAENILLAEIGRIVSSSSDIGDVYLRFVKEVRKLLPLDRIAVSVVDLGQGIAYNAYVGGGEVPNRREGENHPLAGSITEKVLKKRSGVMVQGDQIGEAKREWPELLPTIEAGYKSMISVPLIANDELVGALHLRTFRADAYTERDLVLAESVGAQIAGAIANAKLRSDLEREFSEQAILSEIGRIISSSLDIESIYQQFAEEVRKLVKFDRISIVVANIEEDTIMNTYTAGVEVPGKRPGDVSPLSGSVTWESMRTRKSILLQTDEEYAAFAEQFPVTAAALPMNLRSFLTVPLFFNNEAFGSLSIRKFEANAYTFRDVELAERVSAQISGAISNAELYAKRMRAEAALKEYTNELARSNEELQQFAYVASHDLQEPLRMVSSFTQLLARRYGDKLDQDALEYIEYAVDGVGRMQRLIQDLLEYSRVGTRGKPPKPTDFNKVLDKVIENLHVTIEESEATVFYKDLPTTLADDGQMLQLFQNLIANGIKFRGEDKPVVRVSAESKADEWIFSVSDNGIGIEPRHLEKIFVIFQRLHTREDYPGTGIGLSICKKIVERQGGRIWIESELGKGSTFLFTVPKKVRGK